MYFDDPFWVGVFESTFSGNLSVCKVTFGAEPKDTDVYEFLLRNYNRLKFGKAIKTENKVKADNPKRRIREAKKQMKSVGVGTKSQQALAAMREQLKAERKTITKEEREAEKERKFQLKQEKRKEKHRGR